MATGKSSLSIIGKQTFIKYSDAVHSEPKEISREFSSRLAEIIQKYPSKKSAVMSALYLAQEHYGWIPLEAIRWVSEELDLAPAHVESVATFYTMYYKRPVGKYHFQICRTLSCMLCGAQKISDYLKEKLSIEAHTISVDGMWSWEEVECLGSCGTAPMVQINDVFFELVDAEKLDVIIDKIKKELPDLRYHTTSGELGTGMSDFPRSQVLGLDLK